MNSFSESIAVKAPIENVFAVITDFAHYPKLLPGCKKAVVRSQSKSKARVTFTIDMVKEIQYTLDYKISSPTKITWELVEGDYMTQNSGSWNLTRLEKNLTDAHFDLELGFPFWVPSSLVEKNIQKEMPKLLAHLKKIAESGLKEQKKTKGG